MIRCYFLLPAALAIGLPHAAGAAHYDLIIRGGTVYDGTGKPGRRKDVAVQGDRVVRIGALGRDSADRIVDARGLAVAPGFVNMISQASQALVKDGRSESDIRQGVTLEMIGEGVTMGPLNAKMKSEMQKSMDEIGVQVEWTTQGEFMSFLEKRGISPNIGTFIGASSLRINVIGYDNRKATADELAKMQSLVRQAMEEGAFGISSAIQYAPAAYADTAELTALAKAAAPYRGIYISHLRNEGDQLTDSVDELITIARDAGVPAEIYHLKAFGKPNWPQMDVVLAHIEAARKAGLDIGADMYPYTAAYTGLDITMPAWVQEGGNDAWLARLSDPVLRARVIAEMRAPAVGWSNGLINAGTPDNILIIGAHNPALAPLIGKTIGDVSRQRKLSPEDTIVNLVMEEGGRLQVAYFVMSEENLRKQMRKPWVSFGSDGSSFAAEGDVLKKAGHPRSFGAFARVLAKYVREDGLLDLAEAVHRLSGLPAAKLGIKDRGTLRAGSYADIVLFDPKTIVDRATFANPHLYAVGVRDVFVNGVQVIRDGEHTGAKPGRYVKGSGWTAKSGAGLR